MFSVENSDCLDTFGTNTLNETFKKLKLEILWNSRRAKFFAEVIQIYVTPFTKLKKNQIYLI